MIIDLHTYVGNSMLGMNGSVEELLESMERNEITTSVICPVKTVDPYFEKQNQYVTDLQKQYQGKLASFARIDPNLGKDSEKILREALTGLGAKGLVLHPWEETFTINDKKVFPFMEICEEYQVPVLVESGYPWLAHCFQVANLAEKFPKLRFIMAHGGQFDSSGYAMTDVDFVMDTHDNLYIETSGYFSDEGIENTPKRLGNDRILFGSHFPWLNVELEKYRVERAHISNYQKEAIFYKNAKKILGL